MNAPSIAMPLRVLEPGLNTLPPGTERYVVRAGGITALELAAGDSLELVNPEGMQVGEITVFDGRGNSDMQLIGARADGQAEGLKAICLQHEIDHLNGILLIDHLSSLKRSLYKKKLKKIMANNKE